MGSHTWELSYEKIIDCCESDGTKSKITLLAMNGFILGQLTQKVEKMFGWFPFVDQTPFRKEKAVVYIPSTNEKINESFLVRPLFKFDTCLTTPLFHSIFDDLWS